MEEQLLAWRWPWYWFGNPGCGKTCAAVAVYQAAPDVIRGPDGSEQICSPVCYRMDDLVQMLVECKRKGSTTMIEEKRSYQRSERVIYSMLRRASIVVLDDVGLQRPREGSIEERVIDKLADELQHCRLLVTSNVKPVPEDENDPDASIADIYDDRVASRLLANGIAREWPVETMRNRLFDVDWQDED